MNKVWHTKKLGEVCDYIARGISPKYVSLDGIFVLNQKCVRNHEISYAEARKHNHLAKKVSDEKLIQIGDVLINSTGVGTLGRVAQVKILKETTTVDSHITIVRPSKGVFDIHFFGWLMVYVEDVIKQMGKGASGQTELSRVALMDIEISYPESISEQKTIVKKLESFSAEVKNLEIIYKQNLSNLLELKESFLRKNIGGRL